MADNAESTPIFKSLASAKESEQSVNNTVRRLQDVNSESQQSAAACGILDQSTGIGALLANPNSPDHVRRQLHELNENSMEVDAYYPSRLECSTNRPLEQETASPRADEKASDATFEEEHANRPSKESERNRSSQTDERNEILNDNCVDQHGSTSNLLNDHLPLQIYEAAHMPAPYPYCESELHSKKFQKLIRRIENDTMEYLNLREWQHDVKFSVANLQAVFEALLSNTSVRRVDLEVQTVSFLVRELTVLTPPFHLFLGGKSPWQSGQRCHRQPHQPAPREARTLASDRRLAHRDGRRRGSRDPQGPAAQAAGPQEPRPAGAPAPPAAARPAPAPYALLAPRGPSLTRSCPAGPLSQANRISPALVDELNRVVEEINSLRDQDEPILEIFLTNQVILALPGSTGRSTRARTRKVPGSLEDRGSSEERGRRGRGGGEDSDDLDTPLM